MQLGSPDSTTNDDELTFDYSMGYTAWCMARISMSCSSYKNDLRAMCIHCQTYPQIFVASWVWSYICT